jgi:hypothetical protein
MKTNYTIFNIFCIILSIIFVFGSFFVISHDNRTVVQNNIQVDIPIFTWKDFQEDVIEEVEDEKIEEAVLSVEMPVRGGSVVVGEINLAVPFTSQAPQGDWSQPWQDACEEAALLMFDAYYKEYGISPVFARDEIQKMVDWEEIYTWKGSISLEKVIELGEAFSMYSLEQIQIQENPTIKQIKKSIAAGHPVYAVANGKTLDNPNFTNGGPVYHALIIRGYNEQGFYTNDPGTRNGENFFYTYENLMDSIHDWNGGDVEHGSKVVFYRK